MSAYGPARRRRWIYGGAVVVLAIAAVASFTIPGSPSSAHHAARPVPTPPAPTVAPLVAGPDPASTLLASWGGIHVGYVFVYADGQVIRYPDGLSLIRRRLTRRGLDLVRAGKLDAKWFLGQGVLRPYPHWKIWAERTPRIWEPSKYALCPNSVIPGEGSLDATDIVDELPGPVQAVLDGKQRIYDPSIGTAHWAFGTPGAPGQVKLLTDCFEVTAAEVSNLYQIFLAKGQIVDTYRAPYAWQAVAGRVALGTIEIYPHGQYVIWGG